MTSCYLLSLLLSAWRWPLVSLAAAATILLLPPVPWTPWAPLPPFLLFANPPPPLRSLVFTQVAGFFVEYIILKMFAGLWIELTRTISLMQVRSFSLCVLQPITKREYPIHGDPTDPRGMVKITPSPVVSSWCGAHIAIENQKPNTVVGPV